MFKDSCFTHSTIPRPTGALGDLLMLQRGSSVASHPQTLPVGFDVAQSSKHHSWGLNHAVVVVVECFYSPPGNRYYMLAWPSLQESQMCPTRKLCKSLLFLTLWHGFGASLQSPTGEWIFFNKALRLRGWWANEGAIPFGVRTGSVRLLNRQYVVLPGSFQQH